MREVVWTFNTKQFKVTLELSPSFEPYDGDDEDGETQRKLDDGVYVMFDSLVRVTHKATGAELGYDFLGSSVYEKPSEFWTAHWHSPAEYRNTSVMTARKTVICHYFPDMVREACDMARGRIKELGGIHTR